MTKKMQTVSKEADQYWQDVENKTIDSDILKSEFQEGELDYDISESSQNRRNFLKTMGFSFMALPLASCFRIPVKKALPYIDKSETIVPGVANWYATSMDPSRGEALLVKTREGRPIKIEGNPLSNHYLGGTSPYTQGSLISLYDSERKQHPKVNGQIVDWQTIDKSLLKKLHKISESGKKIYLYTPSISSPSTLQIIAELKQKYPTLEHIVYEPHSQASILNANRDIFESATLPHYRFDKAELVLSFSADFLGTWLSPAEYTKQYTSARDIIKNDNFLRHIQIEPYMSLTGSNADIRLTQSSEEEKATILGLVSFLQRKSGNQLLPVGVKLPKFNIELVTKLGNELWEKRGKSLVVSGSHLTSVQVMINIINQLLGNYGKTLTVVKNPYFKGADDSLVEKSFNELKSGRVGAMMFWDCNPLYDYYKKDELVPSIRKLIFSASFNTFPNETSSVCSHVLPTNFYLESWSDYFKAPGTLSFSQPVIQPLFGTRMFQESLLVLLGKRDYYEYLKSYVSKEFFPRQNKHLTSVDFWNQAVHDGLIDLSEDLGVTHFSSQKIAQYFSKILDVKNDSDFTLVAYEKVGLRKGDLINNPWLQELPDPITKATWDNYVLVNPTKAKAMGLKNGNVVKVSRNNFQLELPVILQPGMEKNTIAIAIGYGRSVSGKVGKSRGGNVHLLLGYNGETFESTVSGVKVEATGKNYKLALTQTHHSMEGRKIIKETTLKEYLKDNHAGNGDTVKLFSIWGKHEKNGNQWAMAIDLTKCTGCSGCIVSCNAENNVPVVGKEEVANRREMHWLRIDRYYKGDDDQPEVVHQPVMCQHCDNAPCETVCPVLATVQSSDGLNQQVYNRCVGTRYCANNCPYKVRRFNWFDYPHKDKYENMVLNPDVVVRSRGVMEKCSMCIQRIQEARLSAKKEGCEVKDGEVKLACQQSCPGDAIVFGDLNDPDSRLSKLLKHPRNYRLLEELNIQPRVSYLTKVRNKDS